MKEWGLAIEGGLLLGCVWALLAICLGVVVVNACKSWSIWRKKRHAAIASLLAVAAIIVGGTKPGRVTVNDPYIIDRGSFVTNDYVHVAVAARFDFIPSDMEILVWSRTVGSTNATDWVPVVRTEEGPYQLREFPLDIPFPLAISNDFMVAANYVPPPVVHTNGVWSIKGFLIPGEAGKAAFPNTQTRIKEEE